MNLILSKLSSPIGEILLATDGQGRVRALDFGGYQRRMHLLLREHYGTYVLADAPAPLPVASALERYFDGDLVAVDSIAAATEGTEFQRKVWDALRRIPAGKTTNYGEMAKALGYDDPRAAIDVGAANGSNPVAIIVPCHRVIAKDGSLRGYAGGLHRKRWLLEHEGALAKGAAKTATPAETARLPGF
jgi:methylated-DNA-[protein]-cysteine S-methyltransferase